MRSLVLLTLLISLLCSTVLAAPPQADLEARRKALNDLLAERWEYTLRTSPIFASILGDKRWNDKIDDLSQKAIDDDLEQSKKVPHPLRSDRHHRLSRAGSLKQNSDGSRPSHGPRRSPFQALGNAGVAGRRHPHRTSTTGYRPLFPERQGL